MPKLVLIRHGESLWNVENRFTGWTDIELSEKGLTEAREAGIILNHNGYTFDIAYTSYLKELFGHYGLFSMKWIACGFLYIKRGN